MTNDDRPRPVNADLADGDEDPTWQALEDLRLELRKPTMRGDRLHDALNASLGDLAKAAASLHAEGGLETATHGAPDELPDEIGESATGGWPGAHQRASPPAAAPSASTAGPVDGRSPERSWAAAEEVAATAPTWVPAAPWPAPIGVAAPPRSAPTGVAAPPTPAPVHASATPAAPRWEADPTLQQPDAPSDAANDPQARGPVGVSVTGPLPERDATAAVPEPKATWSAGASRTNPVPPPTTPTRAPWAPVDTVEQPAPAPNGAPPPSPAAPVSAEAARSAGPPADLADQVQVILAGMRDKAVPVEDGMRDKALASTHGMLDRPVPIAERRVAAKSRDEHADARGTSSPSAHPWAIGVAAMVVLLISAVVTYALLRG